MDYSTYSSSNTATRSADFYCIQVHLSSVTNSALAAKSFICKPFTKNGTALGIKGMGLGLYYFGARYYDPELATWLTQDRAGQFHNPYGYHSNPVLYIDADGNWFWIDDAIAAVVGGVIGGITAAAQGKNIWAGIGIGMAVGVASLYIGQGAAAIASAAFGTSTAASIGAAAIGGAAGGFVNSAASQYAFNGSGYFNGKVDWGKAGIAAASGAIGGAAGAGVLAPFKNSGFNMSMGKMMGLGALAGGVGGAASAGSNYLMSTDYEDWKIGDFGSAVGIGAGTGAAAGALVGAGKYREIQKGSGDPAHNAMREQYRRNLGMSEKQDAEYNITKRADGTIAVRTDNNSSAVNGPMPVPGESNPIVLDAHTHQNQAGIPFITGASQTDVNNAYLNNHLALQSSGSSFIYNSQGTVSWFNTAAFLRSNYINAFFGF